jgi:signal transduction histidine kinase
LNLAKLTDKVSFRAKFCLGLSLTIMFSFFIVQSLVVFKIIKMGYFVALFGYACILAFTPPFVSFVREFALSIDNSEKILIDQVIEKNTYLEHAAKIIRHDMHSGINTYIPRGIRSLERRLDEKTIKNLKIEAPLKLLKEGLAHTQQVYAGVYEFTNLVKNETVLNTELTCIEDALKRFLKRTSYKDQVIIEALPYMKVNEALFCTAIDNLIRNGLKYNDSPTKKIIIKMVSQAHLAVIDNGRGMSSSEFKKLSKPYVRSEKSKEEGTGLGLSICVAILKEHNFEINAEKLENGTMIIIDILNGLDSNVSV